MKHVITSAQACAKTNNDALYHICEEVDYTRLARASEGFNYADVASVVEHAVRQRIIKFSRDKEEVIDKPPTVNIDDLLRQIQRHRKERAEVDNTYNKRRIGFT